MATNKTFYLSESGVETTIRDKNSMNIISDTVNGIPDTGLDGAAAHNCFYRGKDLTSTYSLAQLSTKIQNQDWSDLFIGDYITRTFTNPGASGGTETVDIVFADFDYWYDMGDAACTTHHILCVPKDCFKDIAVMNTTNTAVGGYPLSQMFTTTLPAYYNALNAAGCLDGHILPHRDWITEDMDAAGHSAAGGNFLGTTYYNSATAANYWRTINIGLMKEPMVYGGTVFSSSGYDIGCGKRQLSLFRLNHYAIRAGLGKGGGRYWWWLGAVSHSTHFCGVDYFGYASDLGAAYSLGVRPYFLLK